MKGKISLGEFISEVKNELVQATKERKDDPFLALTDVELEASFSLEAEGEVGMKFVVEAKGTTTASQTHKVTLKFKMLVPNLDEPLGVRSSTYHLAPKIGSPFVIGSVALECPPYSGIGNVNFPPLTVDIFKKK